jgi:hypothetical protein
MMIMPMYWGQVSELERIVGLEAECSKLRNSLQAERSSLRKVVDEKVSIYRPASIQACMGMHAWMGFLSVTCMCRCVHTRVS